jgi:hypothetical protein
MSVVSDQIWKIRDRLSDERYWIKGTLFKDDAIVNAHGTKVWRRVCLLGAHLDTLTDRVAASLKLPPHMSERPNGVYNLDEDAINRDPVGLAITEVIIEQYSERISVDEHTPDDAFARKPWYAIPSFNDADETTHEDVMAVLEKAAIRADEVLSG